MIIGASGGAVKAIETPLPLYFQYFLEPGKVPTSGLGHHHKVLDSHATCPRIVQARLDGHYVSCTQAPSSLPDARGFVNFETETVTRAVKESLHPPVGLASAETSPFESCRHLLVNCCSIGLMPDEGKSLRLRLKNRLIHLPHPRRGTPPDHRSGNVGEVSGPARAGKDIDDNGLMGR